MMTASIALALIVLVFAAGIALWLLNSQARRQSDTHSAVLRQEMQSLLNAQSQVFNTQLG